MLSRDAIPTPLTDEMLALMVDHHADVDILKCVPANFAKDFERDRTELIDALDYWLNGKQKSQSRFAEDSAMLARMKERK